jgi:O-succinylbenzoate synthase
MSIKESMEALNAAQAKAADLNNRILRLSVQRETIENNLKQKEAQGVALYGTSDPDALAKKLAEWEAENNAKIEAFIKEVAQCEEVIVALESELAALNVSSAN